MDFWVAFKSFWSSVYWDEITDFMNHGKFNQWHAGELLLKSSNVLINQPERDRDKGRGVGGDRERVRERREREVQDWTWKIEGSLEMPPRAVKRKILKKQTHT